MAKRQTKLELDLKIIELNRELIALRAQYFELEVQNERLVKLLSAQGNPVPSPEQARLQAMQAARDMAARSGYIVKV